MQYPGSQLLPPALQLKVVRDSTGVGGYNLDAYIEASAFPRIFAQDVGPATIKTMLAHQKSFAAAANVELSGRPSWATTPSWYVVSANDRVIPPAAQRDAAKRIRARTTEIASSHASLVSHPAAVAGVIRQAAR
ncbi:hypothetical protein D7316_03794 [Gordonia insulae]|uniref:AB hydrolase-1 domain-containing protein n=1 Tax=Gordonia insulae TaxID=2420509 RepID=A0A3G8JQD6_9ACTN|nr:hypothetical protein D7316_03794 [Gordonia insulae]